MATIRIRTRLRHFNLLTRITRVSTNGMSAIADLQRMPLYCGLEAMAQLAALHVRHCVDFQRHAFLLKVNRCRWPHRDALQGGCRLTADRYGQSSHGFAYRVQAEMPRGGILDADLLIGTRPYDLGFREDMLKAQYRNFFNRLLGNG